MAVTATSNYSGEFLQEIFRVMRQGTPTVANGHIRLHTGVNKSLFIPRIVTTGPDANIIQARAATPTTGGTAVYAENEVPVGDYMVYLEFNPAIFEDVWGPYQPQGALVFSELAPEVQIEFVADILAMHGDFLENATWQGDTGGAAPYDKFDGIFATAAADATVIDVAAPVALTAVNIIGEFQRLYDAAPATVRYSGDSKIFVPQDAWELYGSASYAQTNKGVDETQAPPTTFRGKQVVALPGLPSDKMLMAISNNSRNSNMHLAVHMADDMSTLQVERKQANSELYFFKMLCKAGVGFSLGQEITAYNA